MRAMDQQEVATLSYTDYTHLFQYFLAAVLLLLLVESIVGLPLGRSRSLVKTSES